MLRVQNDSAHFFNSKKYKQNHLKYCPSNTVVNVFSPLKPHAFSGGVVVYPLYMFRNEPKQKSLSLLCFKARFGISQLEFVQHPNSFIWINSNCFNREVICSTILRAQFAFIPNSDSRKGVKLIQWERHSLLRSATTGRWSHLCRTNRINLYSK